MTRSRRRVPRIRWIGRRMYVVCPQCGDRRPILAEGGELNRTCPVCGTVAKPASGKGSGGHGLNERWRKK